MTSRKEKIFNISLQRTGTQSIHSFLSKIGYDSMHWIGSVGVSQYQEFANKDQLIEKISFLEEKYNAFNDVPYNILYSYYSKKYPNAKFIFITRDFDGWYKSIEKFNEYDLDQKIMRNRRGMTDLDKLIYSEYVTTSFRDQEFLSKDQYKEYYDNHYQSVFKYFENNKNFLSVSLFDDRISEKILDFLQIDSKERMTKKDFLKYQKKKS